MYPPSPITPSSQRSRRSAAAPSTPPQAATVPGAPYMGNQALPPTPYTAGYPLVYAPGSMPPTPHLPTTNLPPVTPPTNYGLLTPPATPSRQPHWNAGPTLNSYFSNEALWWNMRTPVSSLPRDPKLDAFATSVPLTYIMISHSMFDFSVVVQNPNGITVRDVLHALYTRAMSPQANVFRGALLFGGLVLSGSGRGDTWTLSMMHREDPRPVA